MNQFFFAKIQYGYQNAKLDADFESVEKIALNSCDKRLKRKRDWKIEFFTYVHFFSGFEIRFVTSISNCVFLLAIFANFEA
jgi:hypothetical protein